MHRQLACNPIGILCGMQFRLLRIGALGRTGSDVLDTSNGCLAECLLLAGSDLRTWGCFLSTGTCGCGLTAMELTVSWCKIN